MSGAKFTNFFKTKSRLENMAPLLGKHPFFDGCRELPIDKIKDIKNIQLWLNTQPTLPKLSDEHVYMFFHSNYYDLELTKNTILSYFSLRTSAPDLFLNLSMHSPDLESAFKTLYMVPVPKITPEGYRIIIYKLANPNPDIFVHIHLAKAMILFNDIRLAEDGITPGYVVVCDARGFTFSHLTKLNLHVLRVYMKYMQEAKPVRLKGLHVLYSAKIIDKLVTIAKPFMKSELQKLLKIHAGDDLTNFFKYVPQEIMPEDYGGKAESLATLHEKNWKMMQNKYPKWVEEESEFLKEATKIRNSQKKNNFANTKDIETFRNLAID